MKRSEVKVTQSCPIHREPMDCTLHGILQARILEWLAVHFSRGSSQPRDGTQVSHIAGALFTIEHHRSPIRPIVNLVSVYIVIRNTEQTLVTTTSGLRCIRIFGRQCLRTPEACVSCLSSRVRSLRLIGLPLRSRREIARF